MREFGQTRWTITFIYLQDSMMDLCTPATLSTVLHHGTLNRTACVWSSVPTSRSTSALLPTGRDGTALGLLPLVSPVLWLLLWSYCGSATLQASEGVSHSQRRGRSGLVLGHPQPPWRTRHPCTVDVLPGVSSSPGRDEIRAPILLVCGSVEVFVCSRGETVRSAIFLYTSVELQQMLQNGIFVLFCFLKKESNLT